MHNSEICFLCVLFYYQHRKMGCLLMIKHNVTGLDVRAIEKRGGSNIDGGFKIPKVAPVAASMDEEEKFETCGIDEVGSNITNGVRSHASRRYRETSASEITDAGKLFSSTFVGLLNAFNDLRK